MLTPILLCHTIMSHDPASVLQTPIRTQLLVVTNYVYLRHIKVNSDTRNKLYLFIHRDCLRVKNAIKPIFITTFQATIQL